MSSNKTHQINEINKLFIKQLTDLYNSPDKLYSNKEDLNTYNPMIKERNNKTKSGDEIEYIYNTIENLLEIDENFRKRYKKEIDKLLIIGEKNDIENHCHNNEDLNIVNYNSKEIYIKFTKAFIHEEIYTPAHSLKKALYRYIKNNIIDRPFDKEKNADKLLLELKKLFIIYFKQYKHNKWAKELSDIAQIRKEIINGNTESKEELWQKSIYIIYNIYKGEKISNDENLVEHLVRNMLNYFEDETFDKIKNIKNRDIINGLSLKEYIIVNSIYPIRSYFDLKEHKDTSYEIIQKMASLFYDNEKQGEYNIFRSIIVNKSNAGEFIILHLDSKINLFKKIIDTIEINKENIPYLISISAGFTEATEYILNKIKPEDLKHTYNIIINKSKLSAPYATNYIKLIDKLNIPEENTQEHKIFKNELLKTAFISTTSVLDCEQQLDSINLATLFSQYNNDLNGLKDLVFDSLAQLYVFNYDCLSFPKYREYLKNIIVNYYSIYAKTNTINQDNFIDAFNNYLDEKKQILKIQKEVGWFAYNDSERMYIHAYEDDNVKIYYLGAIYGLFLEKKEEKIDSERYYLYPIIDENQNISITKRENILPYDLLNELTLQSNETSYYYRLKEYKQSQNIPNKWPEITIDYFIDLTGDDTLSKEEKFTKTCEIIESNPLLKHIIPTQKNKIMKKTNEN